MTRIKELADQMKDELCSAKDYAEEYLSYKAKEDAPWATRYKEMALDELKHADYIHERAVAEIETLRKVYSPPEDMLEKWDHEHKKYAEKAAWIRQMLAM